MFSQYNLSDFQVRILLNKVHSYIQSQNEKLVNSLSLYTWNLATEPSELFCSLSYSQIIIYRQIGTISVEEGGEDRRSREIRYLEDLGRYLIRMEAVLSSVKQLEQFRTVSSSLLGY